MAKIKINRFKIITFWIGVNIIGIPNFHYHIFVRKQRTSLSRFFN